MKFTIKHEIRGRIRIHNCQKTMSADQADELQYYLITKDFVTSVKIYDRTNDIVICYDASRSEILTALKEFYHGIITVPDNYQESQSRQLNQTYQEKLISKVLFHYGNKLLFPYPLRAGITVIKSVKYIYEGIHTLAQGKIEVPVLDGTAIGVSIIRRDINTASSIMFLLGIGEILEEWTHKKSVDDLAKSMSLNIDKVWKVEEDHEILVPSNEIDANDIVHIQMGNMIPFDGVVVDGEAMVNQASLTGESLPIRKAEGNYVYAGTVLEEGELTILVKEVGGSSRFEKIVTMIEESEKLKSALEGKAEHLADKLVPYSLGGTALTYLLTRNVNKAISVLMVDFSCALKLAMPISVLSAIREASLYHVTVKGGKYLEAVADADTIVFDKTGTLTKAKPTVVDVVSFNGAEPDELLRIAACLEEHFPHSMAKAVVDAAKEKHLDHEEMHSKVEYIVAHGISTTINGEKAIIGSYHFVFEDENSIILEGMEEKFRHLPEEYSHLYLALEGVLAAVICIEDPLRPEAAEIIRQLKKAGLKKIVMMTGDSERTAKAIGAQAGVDEVIAGVLPDGKESVIRSLKEQGKVAMVGDGINDAPALTRADIGIAIGAGTDIAIDAADVVLMKSRLSDVPAAIRLSRATLRNIHENLFWAFFYNVVGIPLAAGLWYPIFGWKLNPMFGAAAMSLSSFCVVTNALRLNLFKMHDASKDHPMRKRAEKAASKGGEKAENAGAVRMGAEDTRSIGQTANGNETVSKEMQKSENQKNNINMEGITMTKTMNIEGMMCGHCEARVKKALEALAGVESAEVSHEKGTAVVNMSADVADDTLKEAVEAQDYKVDSIQ